MEKSSQHDMGPSPNNTTDSSGGKPPKLRLVRAGRPRRVKKPPYVAKHVRVAQAALAAIRARGEDLMVTTGRAPPYVKGARDLVWWRGADGSWEPKPRYRGSPDWLAREIESAADRLGIVTNIRLRG